MYKYLVLLFFLLSACRGNPEPARDPGALRVEAIDRSATNDRFGDNPTFELLRSGMDWSEGPLVLPNGNVIYSDVPRNHILVWPQDDDGIYLKNSGNAPDDYSSEPGSNGLHLSPDGQLLLCQHGGRSVVVMDAPLDDPAPRYITLADNYEGKKFNSPNDLTLARDGSILFTDPPWGLPGRLESEFREIDFDGVYRIRPDSSIQLLIDDFVRPNGIGLSPDEKTLYIAGGSYIQTYQVLDADFNLGPGEMFVDASELKGTPENPGSADGLAVARDGTIYATAPGGVWVLRPDGTVLSKVRTGMPVSNVELAPREDWLYLTSDSQLIRIKLNNT